MTRSIDPEHNWFWQEGYRDAFAGNRADPPDEARSQYHRSDYFAGYEAGGEDRAARDEDEAGKRQECPGCGSDNTRWLVRPDPKRTSGQDSEYECFDCQETW